MMGEIGEGDYEVMRRNSILLYDYKGMKVKKPASVLQPLDHAKKESASFLI